MDRSPFAPESWAELNRLLDTALNLPAADRLAWLDTLPVEQAAIKSRLQALLMRSAQIETGDFLRVLPRIGVSKKEEAALRPPTGHAGDAIGPYRLVRELGSGGMGAVWLAERTDGILHRPVALKLPHVALRHASLAERMAREREILENLSHPHIARLYDAGVTDEGQPYLALEYVEGVAVDEYCLARRLHLRQRLRLFLQIAGAVAYAHGKLVVHRDLKPANVLVTSEGDVRLLDFGIAKLLEEGRTHETVLTQVVGPAFTPDYASPEQIRGEQLGIGSDIYSLGVILFRLLTGERPYRLDRQSRGALEDAVLKAEPARPSEVSAPALRRELRGDLDTIILKCLKKSPHERYATVHALAEDIERYLDGRPVLAQPDTAAYRLRKFIARNKLSVAAAGAVVVAILAGAGAAVWQGRLALAEQKRAEEVKEFIASIFRDANPYAEEGKAVSASELLNRAKEQIDVLSTSRPELRVELLNLVGSSLMGLGDTAGAETVGTEALAESLRLLGPDHAQTVQARLLMVDVHRFRGRTPAMGQELALLKPIVTRAADARPVDLVRTLVDGAHLAVDEGRQYDAVAAAQEAFDVATARLGKRHRETAAAATILAVSGVMLADSRMSKAADRAHVMQTADLALDLVIHAYPGQPRHPRVLEMRATHGRALARAGYQYHRAVAELTEVLNDQRAAFGPSSMVVAYTAGDMAPFQRRVGDIAGALANYDLCLGILAQHMPTDSYNYAVYSLEHGVTLLAARRAESALADLTAAKNALQKLLGPMHWGTLTAQINRASALAHLGRTDEAYRELAPLSEHPAEIKGLMWARYVQGTVQRLAGDADTAVQTQRIALTLIPSGLDARWDQLRILTELGLAQLELHSYDESVVSLQQAQALSTELRVAPSPMTTDVLVALGRANLGLGDPAGALPGLQTADHFWAEFDASSRWAGEAAYWLARCEDSLGHRAEAREAYTRAVRILAKSPFPADAALVKLAGRG